MSNGKMAVSRPIVSPEEFSGAELGLEVAVSTPETAVAVERDDAVGVFVGCAAAAGVVAVRPEAAG
jgi:hypothetical protein